LPSKRHPTARHEGATVPATTTNQLRACLLAGAAIFALAACGGGAAATGPNGAGASSGGGATNAPDTSTPIGGGATQAPGGGATVDACALLTADDIKSVTGYAVAKATGGPQGGVFASGCEWELVADEIVPPSILLGIMTEGGKDYYDKYFAPFDNAEGNTPITGLGDVAMDVGFGTVHVVKGEAFFNLQYLGQKDHEIDLARKLVAHL
jgi:hypothetical protein